MAFFLDLSPCTYFRNTTGPLVAVGWLEGDRAVPTGAVSADFVAKLRLLVASAWQPCEYRGQHECSLCPPGQPAIPWEHHNLFVPGEGVLFASPAMIVHYVEAHGYAPPEEFVRAVLACPAMNSRAYVEAVRANGPSVIADRAVRCWARLAAIDPAMELRFFLCDEMVAERLVGPAVARAAVAATGLSDKVILERMGEFERRGRITPPLRRKMTERADQLRGAATSEEDARCALAAVAVADALAEDPERLCDALLALHELMGRDGERVTAVVDAAMGESF